MTTAAASAAKSRGRCLCPACSAEAAVVLVETGRTAMALALLAPLADQVRQARNDAYAAGRAEGLAEGATRKRKART